MRNLVVACTFMFGSWTAFAEAIPEVEKFATDQLEMLSQFDLNQISGECTEHEDNSLRLALFRLRIQAEIGFTSGVAQVSLVPGLEFFFE